jgi:hypothetical protein
MLVVAPNIKIAKAYYDYLKGKGYSARIVTSEDTPAAKRDINDFKKGTFNILVSVAMASEGLNVPNVSVICFLTNIRSVPWIEQCIARANRIAPDKSRATVYAPADWSFKKAVKMIKTEQLVPLENPEGQQELLPQGERRGGCGEEKPWIIPIASTVQTNETPSANTFPCAPSEAEGILRKNIKGIIRLFLDKQHPGNIRPNQIILYRRMKLVCDKRLEDMNHDELVKVWVWAKKEYGDTQPENIIGEKYGRWTVIEFAYKKNYLAYYKCQCECGSIRIVNSDNLKSGKTYSCGCYNKERASETKKEHGMRNSHIYTVWSRIKSLCYNKNDKSYHCCPVKTG